MSRFFKNPTIRTTVAMSCVLLFPYTVSVALADSYPPPMAPPVQQEAAPAPPQQQLLSPDQLSNLVAPVALYPDGLLGQILAASTYPLEIVEAQQWLQQNRGLQGRQLVDAAKQQNWDPSVQMLVAFPEAMALLTRDIQWTTDLGNAFLAQQADVMNAVQALRAQASNNGQLQNTPQQVVTNEAQNGQNAVAIQPANPEVVYVPVYNPASVWGPPTAGAYPSLGYGYDYGGYGYGGSGYGFGSGVNIASIFSGLLSFASWGWGLGWFTHSLSLVGMFFNLLGGFGGFGGGGYHGGYGPPVMWAHNPVHRLGVPYASAALASRFNGRYGGQQFGPRGFAATRGVAESSRAGFAQPARSASESSWQRFGGRATVPSAQSAGRGFQPGNPIGQRGSATETRAYQNQTMSAHLQTPAQRYSSQSYASPGAIAQRPAPQSFSPRSYSGQSYSPQRGSQSYVASQNYSAPKMSAPHYSAPRTSSPHFSSPHVSAPHFRAPKSSGGGHSGGHAGKSSKKH